MMKKEYWKYLSLSLSVVSAVILVYSIVLPAVTGINVTDIPMGYTNTGLSAEEIATKPNNNDMTIRITPTSTVLTGIGLEQLQDEVTGAVYVNNQRWWGQGVALGEYKHINGYQLGIARHGTPTHSMYVGISDHSGLDTTFERVIEIPTNAFPEEDTMYWVGTMFEDNPYLENYPILACITDANHTDGNYWMYCFSENNPCPDTCRLASYKFSTESWVVLGGTESWDGTFAIYTEEASGGEPPAVSIVITVAIQTAGFIALLGACFSGIKYGLVIGWL